MSYIRPMGDGPITHPDPPDDSGSIIVGTVPPTRVECSALPADSPFRGPGQVCAPSILDLIKGLVGGGGGGGGGASSPPIVDPTISSAAAPDTSLLWYVAAGGAAYYLYRKYGKRRA